MSPLAWARKALPRPRVTIARWIALTTLAAMLSLLLLKWVFSVLLSVWAQPPLLESGLIEKVASVARIIDAAPAAQRQALVRDEVLVALGAGLLLRREAQEALVAEAHRMARREAQRAFHPLGRCGVGQREAHGLRQRQDDLRDSPSIYTSTQA